MKSYDKAISVINDILNDKRLSAAEALEWIDALKADLKAETAKEQYGDD